MYTTQSWRSRVLKIQPSDQGCSPCPGYRGCLSLVFPASMGAHVPRLPALPHATATSALSPHLPTGCLGLPLTWTLVITPGHPIMRDKVPTSSPWLNHTCKVPSVLWGEEQDVGTTGGQGSSHCIHAQETGGKREPPNGQSSPLKQCLSEEGTPQMSVTMQKWALLGAHLVQVWCVSKHQRCCSREKPPAQESKVSVQMWGSVPACCAD